MAITDWPTNERPRERLLKNGAHTLSDAELLAIFLRTGCIGKSAVDLARELLLQFNGLRPLLEADKDTFCQARGLGDASFAQLQAVLEMARRHLVESLKKGISLNCALDVKQYLTAKLRHKKREVFSALFLDNQHRLICYEELFQGTINCAHIHPREVITQAMDCNAAAIILAHNHPSGHANASYADRRVTEDIKQLLDILEIKLLDHMVIGDGCITSFAEMGWI